MGRKPRIPRNPIPLPVEEKRPTGCPLSEIDWKRVDLYLKAGCLGTEIAPHFGICEDTLYRRCEAKFGMTFSAYSRQKKSVGEANLRVKQYDSAMGGNTTLLIWLGKQRLDQRDSDKEKDKLPPLDAIVEKDNENMSLKAQLATIRKELEELKVKIDHKPEAGSQLSGIDPSL